MSRFPHLLEHRSGEVFDQALHPGRGREVAPQEFRYCTSYLGQCSFVAIERGLDSAPYRRGGGLQSRNQLVGVAAEVQHLTCSMRSEAGRIAEFAVGRAPGTRLDMTTSEFGQAT